MVLELLNKQNSQTTTLVEAAKIYPVDPVSTQVTVSNVFLKDGKFIFDLFFNNFDINEFDAIRIIPLNASEINALNAGGLPNNFSDTDKKILFQNSLDVQVFAPQVNLDGIEVSIKELQDENFVVLVILEDSPQENSDIFVISTSKSSLVNFSSTSTMTYKDVFTSRFSELSNLQILADKTYTSDLLYTCDNTGVLAGIFCVDKEKIINDFTKFPRLISIDDNVKFGQLVTNMEVCFYKYDKNENGYIFSDSLDSTKPSPLDNIAIGNKSGYRFYNFSLPLGNYYSDYQFVLKFELNDITINSAKGALNELKIIRESDDRQNAAIALTSLYGDSVGQKFGFRLSNLNNLSIIDFNSIMNRVINELQKEIDNASQKISVNTNIKSEYTQPKPSNSTFYRGFFEQRFEKKINLSDKKSNSFFGGLNTSTGFPSVSIANFSSEDITIFSNNVKSFKSVQNKPTISNFKTISSKGEELTNEGLQLKINLSDANQKLQNFLAQGETEKFIEFVQNKTRDIKLYYLKFIGDTTSALIFSEIDDDFPNLEGTSNQVLVRIDNYEEFYSTYIYVTGN